MDRPSWIKNNLNKPDMVEVFKTDVNETEHARILLHEINEKFTQYEVNFDLEDCDRILRVKNNNGIVDASALINLLKGFGYTAEVLADDEVQAIPSIEFPLFNLFNTLHS
jgi:hypothetical protein